MTDPWQAFVLSGWAANTVVVCGLILASPPGKVEVSYQLRRSAMLFAAPWGVALDALALWLLDDDDGPPPKLLPPPLKRGANYVGQPSRLPAPTRPPPGRPRKPPEAPD